MATFKKRVEGFILKVVNTEDFRRDVLFVETVRARASTSHNPFNIDLNAVYRQVDGILPDGWQTIRDAPVVLEGMILGAFSRRSNRRK